MKKIKKIIFLLALCAEGHVIAHSSKYIDQPTQVLIVGMVQGAGRK